MSRFTRGVGTGDATGGQPVGVTQHGARDSAGVTPGWIKQSTAATDSPSAVSGPSARAAGLRNVGVDIAL